MIKLVLPILLYVAMAEASLKVTSSSRDARHPTAMEVEVQLPQSDRSVRIPLLRNDEYENMPVIVKNKGSVRTFSARQVHHSSHAHYSDIQSKSVMSVREVNGEKRFAGHFTHEGRTYFVEPQAKGHKIRANPITPEQLKQYSEQQKMKRQAIESVSRKKRQVNSTATQDVIEVGVYLDHTVYDVFNALFNVTALSEIHYYYTHIMTGVDIAFRNMASPSVSVRSISLTISQSAATDAWMPSESTPNRREGSVILQTLAAYRNTLANKPDHLMAFTNLDILGGGNPDVCGMAYMGGVCNENAVSINEDQGPQSWGTAAHELAHNMNSEHDGGSTGCSETQHNVMAPSSAFYTLDNIANSYHFSSCSIGQMNSYINGLGAGSCLRQSSGSQLPALTLINRVGLHYSLNQVCELAYENPNSKFFVTDEARNDPGVICATIYCTTASGSGTSRGGLRAPDGTQCGNKKSCNVNGLCTDDENAPTSIAGCFWGDRIDAAQCLQYKTLLEQDARYRPHYCPQLKSYCCQSLAAVCP